MPIHVFTSVKFTKATETSTQIGGINGFAYGTIGETSDTVMFMNMMTSILTKKKFGLLVNGNSSFLDLGVVSEARMKGANN